MADVPYEPVTIKSFDGLKLSGRYYHVSDDAPVKIIFHGYRSMALRDCAGGFGMARRLGMNVLAVDQRAHGNSEGHVISFGINERRDCLSWIEYINNRFGADTPIILSGLSMGAATVVMATSLPLPPNVICVLADCPYSSPVEIIQKVSADQHYPPKLVYPLIRLASRMFGRFNLEEMSAVEAAKHSKIPILLLHGEEDRFVPCDMSKQIHTSSNGCTKLATFPDAGHGLSYMIAPADYEKVVFTFLSQFPALQGQFQNLNV
jgi:fermentation-respiration switch protein FrsA (DUF1100 family)